MNPKQLLKFAIVVFFINTGITTCCNAQASGMTVFDEAARIAQLKGKADSFLSFCVRPIYDALGIDSLNLKLDLRKNGKTFLGFKKINILPVAFQQQYTSDHPYGMNDGSMIPAKGYQNQLSLGTSLRNGIVSAQLRPEIVFAQNSYYYGFPVWQKDFAWRSYYNTVLNVIDAPERFGTGSYLKLFPGQSYIRVNYAKLSLGVSTENLWWGPGVRSSLLMSNNAPGFPHISFNTSRPVISPIGSFEWQVIGGLLKSSGYLPSDTSRRLNGQPLYAPKDVTDRYLNGVVFSWQPKWTKGLFLGFTRVFYQYRSEVPNSLNGFLPVIGKFFKKNLPGEDAKKRDQMASVFFRLIMPREKAELYGEFGRNDHSLDSWDFFLEPEHSRAYIFGFSKMFDGAKRDMQLFTEIASLQLPTTIRLRSSESWYVHYQVRQGYTNYGQVIGAGIGPGGSNQIIGLQWIAGLDKVGGSVERVVHNNDFYYDGIAAFFNWKRHWVDLALNLNKSWQSKRIVYDIRLSVVHSLNYAWYYTSIFHYNIGVGLNYLL